MSAPVRELLASINGAHVGTLRDVANVWSFEYTKSWIESSESFDLAPSLPRAKTLIADGSSERPVQWFFDNLLPEENAREVLAKEARISDSDAFGLLAYYGKESAGAITLLASNESLPEPGYRPLSDEELHKRIADLPRRSLAADAPKRMSNAGAQHKLAISIREEKLFEPVGSAPSTHILKPDHVDTDSWPSSVANEYFVMRLAARLGIDVPSVQIRFVPDPVYIIERFDRQVGQTETRRLHVIDACQLLGLDRTFKYRQATPENMVRLIDLCTNRAQTRQRLLAWTLFNLLIANGDAHLKNLSFFASPGGVSLAPFYDLVSTESYRAAHGSNPRWPERELSMQIRQAKTFAALTREDFIAFATAIGTTRTSADRLLDEFTGKIEGIANDLYAEFEKMDTPTPAVRASQLRILRNVRYLAIHDTLALLR